MKREAQGYLSVALAAILWGAMVAAVVGLQTAGYDVLSIAALRSGLGFLCALAALATVRPRLTKPRPRDLAVFALAGLSGMAGIPLLYFLSIRTAGVSVAALLFYTKPLFVVLFAAVALKEPITAPKTFSVLLGFLGVFLVIKGLDLDLNGTLPWVGILTGIGAGVSGAVFAICNRHSAQRFPGPVANAWNLFFGTLFLWLAEAPRLFAGHVSYSFSGIPWVLAMGTLFSFIPYWLYLRGLREVGAGEANIVAMLEPVTAVLVGLVLFGEHLSLWQGLGILLVLAGGVLITFSPARTHGRATDETVGASVPGGGSSSGGLRR